MIQFTLTEEQERLRELVRDFAQREIVPVAAELDREQRFFQEIKGPIQSSGSSSQASC